jgi:ABC-type transporter Mla subunit MlaD
VVDEHPLLRAQAALTARVARDRVRIGVLTRLVARACRAPNRPACQEARRALAAVQADLAATQQALAAKKAQLQSLRRQAVALAREAAQLRRQAAALARKRGWLVEHFDKAKGAGGAYVENFTFNNQSGDPTAIFVASPTKPRWRSNSRAATRTSCTRRGGARRSSPPPRSSRTSSPRG